MAYDKNVGFDIPAPLRSKGQYPVAHTNDVLGAMSIVDNEAAMLALKPWQRTVGMECYVLGSKLKYRLDTDPDTATTEMTDWSKVETSISQDVLDTLMTKEEWEQAYRELNDHIDDTYVSLEYLQQNYMTARAMMDTFITTDALDDYVTVEQLQNIATMLSRVMVRVVPATVVRVKKGTEVEDLPLPTGMTITFSDGSYYLAPVVWNLSSYDKSLVGYQYIEGALTLPSFVIAKNDITNLNKCNIMVQVYEDGGDVPVEVDKSDISGFEDIAEISVAAGTPFAEISLPSSVSAEVLDSTGNITFNRVGVTWDTSEAPEIVYGAMTLVGEVDVGEELTNLLQLKPKLNIIINTGSGEPKYEYRQLVFLPAGDTELVGGLVSSLTNDLFYGVGNHLKQRKVDLRFMGFVSDSGEDITPELTERYPTGIRMPVFNSTDNDVNAFKAVIQELGEIMGYPVEFDIPGGADNPRVRLDDEAHRLIFGTPSIYKAKFLLSKSATYNLPYPDIT